MDKLSVSYDKEGRGDNYGILYKGDIKFLLKALTHLFFTNKMPCALESHHGTDFTLVDYNLRLILVASEWTHLNKGNGQLKMRIILKDEKWYSDINKYGQTERKEGRLSQEAKEGFKYILTKLGLEIESQSEGRSSISVVISQPVEFVAHIVKVEDETKMGRDEAPNPIYEETHNKNIADLKAMFESYNTLTASL